VLLTPQGAPFSQGHAKRFAAMPAIALVCGRYEGFDERVRHFVDEEVSLGDFVMTGGEVAAMAIVEATVRLLPGVLGNAASVEEESHGDDGLLEYPQYTRPVLFRGLAVPDVLAGGNHKKIKEFRDEERKARTRARRPDLWAAYEARQAALPEPPKRRPRAAKPVRPDPEGNDL
jgi:tRNA (guanine37-N1)-methyltransferase